MDNFVQKGDRMSVALPAPATSGVPIVVGQGLLGIPIVSGVAGATIDVAINGVFEIPKVPAAVIARGDYVYFDVSAAAVGEEQHSPDSGDFICGHAWQPAGDGATTAQVKINTTPPVVN